MKKYIVILILVIVIIIGCCVLFSNNNLNPEASKSSNIELFTGDYWNNEENQFGEIDMTCVPDIESAVQISNTIFHNLQCQGHFSNFVLQCVFYDEIDEVWIVSYAKDIEQDGNDCSIAISAKTAEILKIWVGE